MDKKMFFLLNKSFFFYSKNVTIILLFGGLEAHNVNVIGIFTYFTYLERKFLGKAKIYKVYLTFVIFKGLYL